MIVDIACGYCHQPLGSFLLENNIIKPINVNYSLEDLLQHDCPYNITDTRFIIV
jgi:hypothetical protein